MPFVYFFIHLKTNGEILYIRITSYDSTPKVVPSRGSDDRRRSFSTSLWSRGEIAVPRVFRRLQTPQKNEQAEKRNAFHKPPIVSKSWFHVSFGGGVDWFVTRYIQYSVCCSDLFKNLRYMSMAPRVLDEVLQNFPALSHLDGTARHQSVGA